MNYDERHKNTNGVLWYETIDPCLMAMMFDPKFENISFNSKIDARTLSAKKKTQQKSTTSWAKQKWNVTQQID